MPQPSEREIEVFNAALELPPAERIAYLDRHCAGDASLRRRVEELLQAGDEAGTFLGSPAANPPGSGGTPPLAPPPSQKPGDRIGRYKLLQQIGEGGCGVVYMAEQEEPVHRRVALKIIKLGMDTKSVIARFEAERQALALMDHPNIARVLDAGATNTGRPYFVMELVRGVKITDYCDENKVSTEERLRLFIQVCRAIQHAHQKGVIHRDIKPSNILVTVNDGVAVPMVIDFGIAKAAQGRLTDKTLFTAFEQFIGTPAYMSPEQAVMTSLDVDTRSDIYSLGVLLYELLTGRTPFDAAEMLRAGLDAMRRTILEREPVRPSTRLSTLTDDDLTRVARHQQIEAPRLIHLVRGDLDWVVMKCLEKDRSRRYETANGLAADIQRHLDNEPVTASPPGNLYRFQKLVRRNKFVFAAAGAVAVALLAGLTGVFWQWRRAEHHAAAESRLRVLTEEQSVKTRLNLYAADVNLASQAIQRGDFGLGRRTLAALWPRAGEPDLRGFEWRYLWNLCKGNQLATLTGHKWIVTCTAFSPDGTLLATGSQDGTVKIWDVARRELLTTLPGSADGSVWSVAFSPDGALLMTAGAEGKVKFWNTATKLAVTNFPGKLAALSKTGSILAAADSSPFVWEPAGKVTLWNYRTGEMLKQLDKPGRALALSPDGRRLAVAGLATGVDIYDVATGQPLRTLPTDNSVWSLSFSPDGNRLITAGWSSEPLIWNLAASQPPDKLTGHYLAVWSGHFSPDGSNIVTTGTDQTVRLWDAATLRLKNILRGHDNEVWCAASSPDGKLLATGGKDQKVMLWSALPPAVRDTLPNDRDNRPIFSPDGTLVLTGVNAAPERQFKIWQMDSQSSVAELRQDVEAVGFSAEGNRVITWDTNAPGLLSWSPKDNTTTHVSLAGTGPQMGLFNHFGFDLSRETFFAFDGGGLVRFWESRTGKLLGSVQGPLPPIRSVVLGPGGEYLAVSLERENTVRLYQRSTGREMQLTGHHDFVSGLAFTPDGTTLASGSMDGTIRLWETSTGKLLTVLPGHMEEVTDLAFSPDGRTLASLARGESVKLWHLSTQRELLSLDLPGAFRYLQFSPDGRYLAVTMSGDSVRFFGAPTLDELDGPDSAQPSVPSR